MSVMIAFRVPEDLKARMEEAARKEGLTLTAWLVQASEFFLGDFATAPRWLVEPDDDDLQTAQKLRPVIASIAHDIATKSETKAQATRAVASLARMEREETQRNCRHPLNRRIGKACPVCGKDPV